MHYHFNEELGASGTTRKIYRVYGSKALTDRIHKKVFVSEILALGSSFNHRYGLNKKSGKHKYESNNRANLTTF